MYQSSDWGFTQALSFDHMATTANHMAPGALSSGGNRVSYGLNNIGVAYNLITSSGLLTSLSLGFGYDRAANFNSRTRIETFGEDSSIADMFARQLNLAAGDPGNPLTPGDLDPSARPFENLDIYLDEWGAVLGWQNRLTGLNDEGGFGYFPGALPSDSYFGSVTHGGIHEYNVSLGANLYNILYLGATVGVTQVNYVEQTSYEEFYSPDAMFDMMWYDQTTRIDGSGLTAKLGLILRPLPALRIGAAFHLPTYYTIEKSYEGAMGTTDGDYQQNANIGNPLRDTQRYNTAPRLMTGVSAIIADRAIVALDWEMTWYDKIRRRSEYVGEVEDSKRESLQFYKPGQTLRAGFEYLLDDRVSLRAGGAWMGDFMRSGDFDPEKSDNPAMRSGYSVTGGVGFNIGTGGYLDMAYVYNRARMTDFDFYFYDDGNNIASQYDMSGGGEQLRNYTPTRNRHMITLTLGSRF
jgi:hypothetical protein